MTDTHRFIEVDIDLLRVDNRHLLKVDAPLSPPGSQPPMHRGIDHALLRPYEKFNRTGKPHVGSVQYHFIDLPDDEWPRVHFAASIRDQDSVNTPGLLPGNVFIFPGISADQTHRRDDQTFDVHHLTVREADNNRIEAYAQARPVGHDKDTVREGRSIQVDEFPPIIHVGQVWIRDRSALDLGGTAFARLSDGAVRSMEDRGVLTREPVVRNHNCTEVPYDTTIKDYPNYLWTGFFLAQNPPSDAEYDHLTRFFHVDVARLFEARSDLARRPADPHWEYPGDPSFSAVGMDLTAIGTEAVYPYLVAVQGVLPGEMEVATSLVSFAQALDFDRRLKEDPNQP